MARIRNSKFFRYKGPSLEKILRTLEKKNIDMVKGPMRESAKVVSDQAKEDAPVLTGAYRKSIRRSVRSNVRRGEVTAQVGIPYGVEPYKYSHKIERKYFIFTRLEKTQAKPVRREFESGIRKYFNTLRIK